MSAPPPPPPPTTAWYRNPLVYSVVAAVAAVTALVLVVVRSPGEQGATASITSTIGPTTTAPATTMPAEMPTSTTTTMPPATTTTTNPLPTTTTTTVAVTAPPPPPTTTTSTTLPPSPPGYRWVAGGGIMVEVPEGWTQDTGGLWEEYPGGFLVAAADLAAFGSGWASEGVSVAVFDRLDTSAEQMLDGSSLHASCTFVDQWSYEPPNLAMTTWNRFRDCGGTAWMSLEVAGHGADASYIVVFQFRLPEDPGPRMVEHVVESFRYLPAG